MAKRNIFDPNYAPYGKSETRGNRKQWRESFEYRMMDEDEAVATLDTNNPYTILGLTQGAGKDEVKSAFRIYAKKWHPDHNSSDDAEEMFKKGHAAYSVLMGK